MKSHPAKKRFLTRPKIKIASSTGLQNGTYNKRKELPQKRHQQASATTWEVSEEAQRCDGGWTPHSAADSGCPNQETIQQSRGEQKEKRLNGDAGRRLKSKNKSPHDKVKTEE